MDDTRRFVFEKLPLNEWEWSALPEMARTSPFETAALTVLALCVYAEYTDAGIRFLNELRGPRPLSVMDQQFLKDRFRDGKTYVPFSYFEGALPANDYTPDVPYAITVTSDLYTYSEEGYARLYVKSSGADSARPIKLRQKGDGTWCLWEQFLLSDIRKPKSKDPWA